ncbi:hypothetical protein AVEN_94212-1 [Araneus ventricosus]|uniref:Uncharacterized protein n=1 Tax=Araneus ventricosus TaxID=182803 RepID=A0A4Y2UFA8_ARAVE|nr:hypothetical protein AVEN_94212-1 [Araneus ventricosus]
MASMSLCSLLTSRASISRRQRLLGNINRLFHSLLQNRKVTLLTPQGRATKEQKQGCPQYSCSSPALWNLVPTKYSIKSGQITFIYKPSQMILCWSLKRIQMKAL